MCVDCCMTSFRNRLLWLVVVVWGSLLLQPAMAAPLKIAAYPLKGTVVGVHLLAGKDGRMDIYTHSQVGKQTKVNWLERWRWDRAGLHLQGSWRAGNGIKLAQPFSWPGLSAAWLVWGDKGWQLALARGEQLVWRQVCVCQNAPFPHHKAPHDAFTGITPEAAGSYLAPLGKQQALLLALPLAEGAAGFRLMIEEIASSPKVSLSPLWILPWAESPHADFRLQDLNGDGQVEWLHLKATTLRIGQLPITAKTTPQTSVEKAAKGTTRVRPYRVRLNLPPQQNNARRQRIQLLADANGDKLVDAVYAGATGHGLQQRHTFLGYLGSWQAGKLQFASPAWQRSGSLGTLLVVIWTRPQQAASATLLTLSTKVNKRSLALALATQKIMARLGMQAWGPQGLVSSSERQVTLSAVGKRRIVFLSVDLNGDGIRDYVFNPQPRGMEALLSQGGKPPQLNVRAHQLPSAKPPEHQRLAHVADLDGNQREELLWPTENGLQVLFMP